MKTEIAFRKTSVYCLEFYVNAQQTRAIPMLGEANHQFFQVKPPLCVQQVVCLQSICHSMKTSLELVAEDNFFISLGSKFIRTLCKGSSS